MAEYISKDALVAELNNRINLFKDIKNETTITLTNAWVGILSFINNLEVKEVDFNKELLSYYRHTNDCGSNIALAKHFFELGMSVSKK